MEQVGKYCHQRHFSRPDTLLQWKGETENERQGAFILFEMRECESISFTFRIITQGA